MSIESFLEAYPTESFAKDMSRRPEYGSVSPIRLMADRYIAEGSNGLKELHDPVLLAMRNKDQEAISKLRIPFLRNASSVYFGATTRAIERMIADHEFDQYTHNSIIECSFDGMGWKPFVFENPKIEPVSGEEVGKIIQVAKTDKTFAEFFRSEVTTLPKSLYAYLKESELLKHFDELILPEYTTRIKTLIPNL